MIESTCIACEKPSGYNWFCPECAKIKEDAYRESAQLGEDWVDTILRRDAALLAKREQV